MLEKDENKTSNKNKMSISKRSQVPKWQKRVKGIRIPSNKKLSIEDASKQPMNFHHRDARKPRPDTGKKITKMQSYH